MNEALDATIHTDEATGRLYAHDPATGRSKWLYTDLNGRLYCGGDTGDASTSSWLSESATVKAFKQNPGGTDLTFFPHAFYTTGAMEASLDNIYQTELARTQIELDDRERWPNYFKEHWKDTSRLLQEAGARIDHKTVEEALEWLPRHLQDREKHWHQRVLDAKHYVRRPMPHFRRSLNPRDTKGWQCVIGDKITPALWAHDDLCLPIGSELESMHHARKSFFSRTGGKVYNVESRRSDGPLQVRPKDVNTKYILSFDMYRSIDIFFSVSFIFFIYFFLLFLLSFILFILYCSARIQGRVLPASVCQRSVKRGSCLMICVRCTAFRGFSLCVFLTLFQRLLQTPEFRMPCARSIVFLLLSHDISTTLFRKLVHRACLCICFLSGWRLGIQSIYVIS